MLKKNLEEELNYIKDNLDAIANNLCNIHKIASILNKYCKTNSDNDDLYEVSYLAELLEEKIGKINYNFYMLLNYDKNFESWEDTLQNLKHLIEIKKIKYIDD